MRHTRLGSLMLLAFLLLASRAFAQGDAVARAAQWDSYPLPAGNFVRQVDRQKGLSFWRPAEWEETKLPNGSLRFSSGNQAANLLVMVDQIPDGYGIASYATSMLQQFRTQQIKPETMVVRRVVFGGIEGREFHFELEVQGQVVSETFWVAAAGAQAFAFILGVMPGEQEKFEPYFKRLVMSARFNTAGRWDEDFESLRARWVEGSKPKASREVEAAQLAEVVRTSKEPTATTVSKLAALAGEAPDAVLDLLTDPNPQVRAAAVTAISRLSDSRVADALLWALSDKDIYCSTAAARGLAERTPSILPAIKKKLPSFVETPAALLRLGAMLGDDAARELTNELLQSADGKLQFAGLQLTLMLPLKGLRLPYQTLLASPDERVLNLIPEAARLRSAPDEVAELLKLMGGATELGAVKALGEIAPVDLATRLEKRMNEIDAQLGVVVVSANKRTAPPPPPPPKPLPKGIVGGKLPGIATAHRADSNASDKGESMRLATLRGALFDAIGKIKFRDRYAKATDASEREAIVREAEDYSVLSGWARKALVVAGKSTGKMPASLNAELLKSAPTTGETLFPSNATLYLMSPNFEQTLQKLDAALSSVQMPTVRDQMTFALIFKALKASLTGKFDADSAASLSAAVGLDLKAPLAVAAWPAAGASESTGSAIANSAVVARVTDRARFERLLAQYQAEIGNFDSFAAFTSGAARFTGITPAVLPLIFMASASIEPSGFGVSRRAQRLNATVYFRREQLGELPVTVIEQLSIVWPYQVEREAIYIAYFGQNAIVAPSREALLDVLKTSESRRSLADSEAFIQTRKESGELVFFSRFDQLYRNSFPKTKPAEDAAVEAFAKVLGLETGALRLSPNDWETVFHLSLPESDFSQSLRPFKSAELSAPRDLLPSKTIFYAGLMLDPPKLWGALKRLAAEGVLKEAGESATKPVKVPSRNGKRFEEEVEKILLPNLQGEAAFALLEMNSWVESNGNRVPALACALKLKNGELAARFRAGKLFPSMKLVPNAAALGGPVATLNDLGEGVYFTVTDSYLVLADSLKTLKLLEGAEKFAASRDFGRSAKAAPESLTFFATYNLDAAFEQARAALSQQEATKPLLNVLSAWMHAFHSQRAVIAVGERGLEGKLAVAFDREGQYSVGAINRQVDEFDVANALVAVHGVSIWQPTRVESLRLRARAKQPEVAARVREDLSKFPWQRVEPKQEESVLVFTSANRQIPEKMTVKLPVIGADFAPYLRPTARINSAAPEIIKLAREVAGKDRDGRSVAHKLGEWTYSNLKWKKVESTTVETLASREADCLEHSELYVALARSLGLPARVVTGAAYGGGSFGAHAWVEIYLGQWVEVDPTWGMMDYVDATHLRFDGDSFASYAMLNQLDLEVVEARSFVADYQRDPLRLVKTIFTPKREEAKVQATVKSASTSGASKSRPAAGRREAAFDLALAAEQALGAGAFAKLDERRREAVINAFDRIVGQQVAELREGWDDDPRILGSEIKNDRASLLVLRGISLLRVSLAARDGAWFITEIEDTDELRGVVAAALRAAADPEKGVTPILKAIEKNSFEAALRQTDRLIKAEGESAALLFLKAQALRAKRNEQLISQAKAATSPGTSAGEQKTHRPEPPNEVAVLLQQIAKRWPDFAPAYYALAEETGREAPAEAVAAYRHYAELMPLDPRPWTALGSLLNEQQRFGEAESAFREAVRRDQTNHRPHVQLANFYLEQNQPEKARLSLAAAFKVSAKANEIFNAFGSDEDDDLSPEMLARTEALLQSFPQELAKSQDGLRVLARMQQAQQKYEAAIATMQRVTALKAESTDYLMLAEIHLAARQFAKALGAADQSLKLEAENPQAHYQRACALAQLNRKAEALAALKQALALQPAYAHMLSGEADLQPVAGTPEFKALLPKAEESQPKEDPAPPKPKQV